MLTNKKSLSNYIRYLHPIKDGVYPYIIMFPSKFYSTSIAAELDILECLDFESL